MKNDELEVINLDHANPTVSDMQKLIEKHRKVWVGFNEKRYFILNAFLLERFIENYGLENDDLVESIFQ